MTTITKEFAQDIINGHGYGVAPSAVEALARIALASLEAEPVAIIDVPNLDYLAGGMDATVWPLDSFEHGDVMLYATHIAQMVQEPRNSAGVTKMCRSDENVQEVPPICQRAPAWTGANCVDPQQCYIAGWNACRAAMLKTTGE